MPRESISKGLRVSILTRDNYTCQYCGARARHVELQMEHVIAVSNGGSNHPSNIVTACRDCNAGKGPRSLYVEAGASLHSVMSYAPDHFGKLPSVNAVVVAENIDREATVRSEERCSLLMDRLDQAHFKSVMYELSHAGRESDTFEDRWDWELQCQAETEDE